MTNVFKCGICGKEHDNYKAYLECSKVCAKNLEAKEAEEFRKKEEQASNKRINRILELYNEMKPLLVEEQKATGATEESIFNKLGIDLSALSGIIPSTIEWRPFYVDLSRLF